MKLSIKELNEILYCLGKINMLEHSDHVRNVIIDKINKNLDEHFENEMRKQEFVPITEFDNI